MKKNSVNKGSLAFKVKRQVPMAHNYTARKGLWGEQGLKGLQQRRFVVSTLSY